MFLAVTIEQWLTVIGAVATVLIPAITAAVVVVVREIRVSRQELKLPSNGTTAGAAIEAIAQVQTMGMQLAHPNADIPSAIKLARELVPGQAPERRATDPPLPPPPASPVTPPVVPDTGT